MHTYEDDDIKIASGSFANTAAMDSAEEAARQFLIQKNSGNIDKARGLGKAFAEAMIHMETGPLNGETRCTQREVHHKLLLYSYVVNRVIAEYSPNSILAQTSLNVFYSEVEADSPELHSHVSDMAAFSLYTLCERTPNRTDDEIGSIYAGLCDFGGDPEKISDGNAFYNKAYAFCKEKINATQYS